MTALLVEAFDCEAAVGPPWHHEDGPCREVDDAAVEVVVDDVVAVEVVEAVVVVVVDDDDASYASDLRARRRGDSSFEKGHQPSPW